MKLEIGDEQSKILDYGCGFGQIMSALKNEKYENVFGVDIEQPAINHCLDNNLNVLNFDQYSQFKESPKRNSSTLHAYV